MKWDFRLWVDLIIFTQILLWNNDIDQMSGFGMVFVKPVWKKFKFGPDLVWFSWDFGPDLVWISHFLERKIKWGSGK